MAGRESLAESTGPLPVAVTLAATLTDCPPLHTAANLAASAARRLIIVPVIQKGILELREYSIRNMDRLL
jgi:hypothetical protein